MEADALIRVLYIEDNPAHVDLVRTHLAESPQAAFSLETAERIEQALESLAEQPFDAILLNHRLGGSAALNGLERVLTCAQGPVILLTAAQDDATALAAIRKGAQDCLVLGSMDPDTIRRTILYAIERHRQHPELLQQLTCQARERQRESDYLREFCMAAGTPISSHTYGATPLRESAADIYRNMVARYADALDQALVVRAYRTEETLSSTLQDLAVELCCLRVGPRDVVDIHTAALKQKVQGATLPKTQAYVEEARLMLLETMGHLAGCYRSYSYGNAFFNIR